MTENPPGTGLLSLLTDHIRGVLVTLKRDGRPQISNVGYAYDAERGLIRISATDSRAKTRNLRRDPRASFHVTTENLGAYVVVEGTARITPVAADPHDATVEELIDLYRAIRGEHPDWDEYREAMVAEGRLVITIPVERVYGWSPESG
jgi:PPOX class probable F420-dependent enzyme